MLKSMTGFGIAEAEKHGYKVSVELRSVNHRFLDISLRLPRALLRFEDALKARVRQRIERGRVSLTLSFESQAEVEEVRINQQLVNAYVRGAENLGSMLGVEDKVLHDPATAGPMLATILAQPEVMERHLVELDLEDLKSTLIDCLDRAIDQADEMKQREGASLGRDLLARLDLLAKNLEKIKARAPEFPQEAKTALENRLARLLDNSDVDPQRLAQEVALLADRSDITEECVRLKSHLEQFDTTIRSKTQGARRMGFLLQEMHREVNTIGSKTGQLDVTNEVLLMKEEIEKLREQIQNLE